MYKDTSPGVEYRFKTIHPGTRLGSLVQRSYKKNKKDPSSPSVIGILISNYTE